MLSKPSEANINVEFMKEWNQVEAFEDTFGFTSCHTTKKVDTNGSENSYFYVLPSTSFEVF